MDFGLFSLVVAHIVMGLIFVELIGAGYWTGESSWVTPIVVLFWPLGFIILVVVFFVFILPEILKGD